MQNATTFEADKFVSSEPSVYMAQVPLSFLHDGDCGKVVKIRGNDEVQHHLKNLGFVEGAEVRVFSEQSGNLIVEIKGARIAIDKTAASKIIASL